MAQTLNKGAPLDVQFINDLVSTVERLVADSNTSQFKRTTVQNTIFEAAAATTVRTADARIHAETFSPPNKSNLAPGIKYDFTLPLSNYATAPVVTVTPILINETANPAAITVVITSITAAQVKGYFYSNAAISGSQQVWLSLIAIGIPSNSTGTATSNLRMNSLNQSPPQTN